MINNSRLVCIVPGNCFFLIGQCRCCVDCNSGAVLSISCLHLCPFYAHFHNVIMHDCLFIRCATCINESDRFFVSHVVVLDIMDDLLIALTMRHEGRSISNIDVNFT